MTKLNWKRLLIAALLLLLLLLLLRGLFFSCRAKEAPPYSLEFVSEPERMLSLYLHREKKSIRLGLEEYIVGVVASEMPASFKPEALKAQAVASRTYALRRLLKGGCSQGCDLCSSSSCCQAYKTDAELKKTWGGKYSENLAKISE
ncbi:MAG TPA: SpoIID/LytB domain-containing protein, partial [Clostridia bacterium]|nr:SpoIID/LytB domain-containing protein [Clostridia bacterium]